ncbi:metallophosphoesterase [Pedobacter puniceum]|jgi:hypothetical protein|uniref:Metallophosphoesterase n=1 Tax=Pedobacter puniceum TaxID=2666136 RepID=A0A7K0FM42_9SPHI|nr:metallophosphoesterase [Pedobacter puniceum]MRX46300.1 metallophosphoesterase [Pedobacter puniceum]
MLNNNLTFEVLLIGDSGNISRNKPDAALELLKNHLPQHENSAVIFLGDNIYPNGLPAPGTILREDAETVLKKHHDALKDYKGKVVFISGNHDWNKGKANGLAFVLRQEEYLKQLFDDKFSYLPPLGCPGPSEVILNDDLVLIAINTQWWVQKGVRPIGKQYGCDVENEAQFFTKLEQLLSKHQSKKILVIGHYPIYSYSLHGGKYKLKHHLFPFTLYKKKAYLPLPFVGSLLPLYRKYVGAREDLAHPRFKILRKRLKEIFRKYPGLIYAAGHEHNLQYIEKYHNHYIVSGAASKATYVLDGKYSRFGISGKGFFKLRLYKNMKIKTEVLITDKDNPLGELVYQGWIV